MTTTSYCVKCRKSTLDVNPQVKQIQTNKGVKYQKISKCNVCGKTKSTFVSKQAGEGLLGKLLFPKKGKIPVLGDIPLLGNLLF